MRQVLFRIPIGDGIPIYGFGMMLLAAFLSCIWLAKRRAAKVGIDRTVIEDLAIYIFGGGIVGARVCYLLVTKDALRGIESPLDFLGRLVAIWDGGIVFYGACFGAIAAYFVGWYFTFRFRENVTTMRLADVIAPTVALGLLLGRVGCFLNGCCYGQVACAACPAVHFPMSAPARSDLVALGYQTPAGFLIDSREPRVTQIEPGSLADRNGLKAGDVITEVNEHETASAGDVADLLTRGWKRGESELRLTVKRRAEPGTVKLEFTPRTIGLLPTQLYESISMILVMLVLFAFDGIKRRDGQVMALMMICYGIHRYVNEILRIDQRPAGFESYVSILLVVSGVGMMVWLALFPRSAAATAIPPAQARASDSTLRQ